MRSDTPYISSAAAPRDTASAGAVKTPPDWCGIMPVHGRAGAGKTVEARGLTRHLDTGGIDLQAGYPWLGLSGKLARGRDAHAATEIANGPIRLDRRRGRPEFHGVCSSPAS